MQPIFKELIQMWNDLGSPPHINEGIHWLDNGLIKGFDKTSAKLVPIYKYTVNDDLTISIKQHKAINKHKTKKFETWMETASRYKHQLDLLEIESIKLLQEYGLHTDRRIINTNSTGKDSMAMLHLARKAKLQFETYFNVTTLDVGESNRMAKELGFKFTKPKPPYDSFYRYVNQYDNIPSRLNRFCCEKFKENATMDEFDIEEKLLFLFGMRNDESNARSGYTDVWINEKWGDKRDWVGILPIRKWTDLDIWLYTFREGIEINQKYKMGYSRVGCAVACPNYGKPTWILDKYWYSKLYQRWQNILRENFIRNNKWIIMNCTVDEYCNKFWTGGVAYNEPSDEVIKEYAIQNEIDFEVAKKYFNRYCMNGCSRKGKLLKIKDKEVLAMNMKFLGRNLEKFQCKRCLYSRLKRFSYNIENCGKIEENVKGGYDIDERERYNNECDKFFTYVYA